jgi:hypothetical protein
MTTSNIYAEKVFAEHPTSLWSLDDDINYISFISESDRGMSSWAPTTATVTEQYSPAAPFSESVINRVVGTSTASDDFLFVELKSQALFATNTLSSRLETFCIGAYVYSVSEFITNIEIGYEYTDSMTSQVVRKTRSFNSRVFSAWTFVSHTFEVPDVTETIRLVFNIKYINPDSSDPDAHTFLIHGVSVGQWSEEFCATSLGTTTSSMSLLTGISGLQGQSGVIAEAYGLQEKEGYYLVDSSNKILLAKNHGVPMVYGAQNATRIRASSASIASGIRPSLILPGSGFLNNSGKFKDYTFESWIKINGISESPLRIVGPIGSTDGIYVYDNFIKIQVGEYSGAYCLGTLHRPMLVHFKVSETVAELLINGERCVSIDIDQNNVSFPNKNDSEGLSQDWIGFYVYGLVDSIELDAVAIYDYLVPDIVAKRRFIYGQGVESPDLGNTAYDQKTVSIDRTFSKSSANFSYPNNASWSQADVENLLADGPILSIPDHVLPETFVLPLGQESEEEALSNWQVLLATQHEDGEAPFISFADRDGYLYFDKIEKINQRSRAIYCIFSSGPFPLQEQILFKVLNSFTGDYFTSSILGDRMLYKLYYNGSETLLYEEDILNGSVFFSGINMKALSEKFGSSTAAFFGNYGQLSLFVGGDTSYEKTFTGKILKVGISTARNLALYSQYIIEPADSADIEIWDAGDSYFGNDPAFWTTVIDGGTVAELVSLNDMSEIFDHVASYTVIPKIENGKTLLGISVDSHWEDYVPLSYFSRYVADGSGQRNYQFDFLQLDIDYQSILDHLSDTSEVTAPVEIYITFQDSSSKNISKLEQFSKTSSASSLVIPGDEWINTAYRVLNGAILYPPSQVSIDNLNIVIHLNVRAEDILTNRLTIRSLGLSSQSLDRELPGGIGTKFGKDLSPYSKYGAYVDYNSIPAFRLYSGSTPYLYMTKDSGIEILPSAVSGQESGAMIQVNENLSQTYKLITLQMQVKRSLLNVFSEVPELLFELDYRGSSLKFFAIRNDQSGLRARVYAVDSKTGLTANGLVFYVNGLICREPVISLEEWTTIGIDFSQGLDFNSYVGSIRILDGLLFNNISYYKATSLNERERVVYRKWAAVKDQQGIPFVWDDWEGSFTWQEVLVISSDAPYSINASDVYALYSGTNKIVVDDGSEVRISGYEYRALLDVSFVAKTAIPV